jgi:hypothetical protein
MTSTLLASQHVVAAGGGVQAVGYLVGLAIFIFVTVDVWRTNAPTGAKVGWTIFAFFCTIIALVVWFVWGKKRYAGGVV